MSFRPSPKQSLFLWKMIAAETPELREPQLSKARPELDATKERKPLVDNGFLETEKRGNASYLLLTDRAWAWAAGCADVELMQSNSRDGAIALQGLIRRLLPALQRRGIPLAELFTESRSESLEPEAAAVRAPSPADAARRGGKGQSTSAGALGKFEARVWTACQSLSGGQANQPVRLAALRAQLTDAPAEAVDAALLQLQRANRIALYREDNLAQVTDDDERAALSVGNAPRHILYLRG